MLGIVSQKDVEKTNYALCFDRLQPKTAQSLGAM